MKQKQVLFIQGGGENGYEADQALFLSLKDHLGEDYQVDYPEIQSDIDLPDYGWTQQIGAAISSRHHQLIVVGHSFGASMILKYLSENSTSKTIRGIFLLATPFWGGNETWQAGLRLDANFADKLPAGVPIFLYHCQDDEEVPFSHFEAYRQKLPGASFGAVKTGGHQFNNDLALVAKDIRAL